MMITVLIPTHNPRADFLRRCLAALGEQTLSREAFEVLLIDNNSEPPVEVPGKMPIEIVRESRQGLTHARRAGMARARGEVIVLVDDDNVLAPDFLEACRRIFQEHREIGAAGGRSVAEFVGCEPEPWHEEFLDVLAIRDLGKRSVVEGILDGDGRKHYPRCAPIGAGMAIRAEALKGWLNRDPVTLPSDRSGSSLASGGDNDIVFSLLGGGWKVGYFPELVLTHLIPPQRLEAAYLMRLVRAVNRSWIEVLRRHDACPWEPIPRWSVPLRTAKAYFTRRAWSSKAASIRWHAACGHFEGRAM